MWQGIDVGCKGGWSDVYLAWPEVLLCSSGSSKLLVCWYSWPRLFCLFFAAELCPGSLLPLSSKNMTCFSPRPNLFRLCRLWGNRSHGLSPLNQTPWTSSRANCAAWAILRFCDYASPKEWAKMTSSHHLLCKCLTKTVAFCACCSLRLLLTLPYLIGRELREKIQPEILELIKQQRLNRLCEGSSFRKIGNRRRQGKVTASTAFFHVKNCRQTISNGLICQQACCQKGKVVTWAVHTSQ